MEPQRIRFFEETVGVVYMAVESFISLGDAKQTTEKEVKRKPSVEELTTVESPGKPSPALMLEDTKEKTKTRRKLKPKSESIDITKKEYTLIITEKPQAAAKIAAALGNERKLTDEGVSYYELTRNNEKILVASAVGHLFNLTYIQGQKGWPIFNLEWTPSYEKNNSEFTRKYFNLLKKLSRRSKEFIVATDFDNEGEVIGWNVLRFICNQKTAKRMKYSTLTKDELIHSYETPLKELAWGNAYAGEARHYIDWLYGINLSRALMSAIKKSGVFRILSIGRVQGPALKIIVDREREIKVFKPEPFWQVFALSNNIEFKFPEDIFDKKLLEKFKGIKEAIAETKKTRESLPPNTPFDLTTLQREAYRLHKLNPSETLKIAQKLYLDGLISYPRTSSQKIPDSIEPKKILKVLSKQFPEIKEATRAKPFEGSKSDPAHPSIFPTGEYDKLSGNEEKLYNLIVRRFIACFYNDAITNNKRIVLTAIDKKGNPLTIDIDTNNNRKKSDEKYDSKDVDNKPDDADDNGIINNNSVLRDNSKKPKIKNITFSTSGLEVVEKGWTKVYPTKLEEIKLPDMNGKVKIDKIETKEKETQPPNRYSPSSLITLLEKKNLGTKCLTSDTKILLNNKEVCIKEIFNSGEKFKNEKNTEIRKIDIKTLSLYENENRAVIGSSNFISKRKKGETEEIIKIETPNSIIKATEKHLIYTYNKSIEKKSINSLRIGDNIVALTKPYQEGKIIYELSDMDNKYKIKNEDILHKFSGKATKGIKLTNFPIKWSTSLAWILGYYYGDGSYSNPRYNGSNQVYFTTTEKKALNLLVENIKNIFGNEPYCYNLGGKYKVNCNSAMSAVLIKLFPKLEGKHPIDLPQEFIGDFLRGFFDADGNVHLRPEKRTKIKGIPCNSFATPRIKITLANEELIKWVSALLNKMGIDNHINKNISKCRGKIFDCWTILLSGKEKVEKFAMKVGFDSYKEDILFKGLKCNSFHYVILKNAGKIYFNLTKGEYTPEEIAKKNNISRYNVMYAIKHLRKLGLISKRRIGNRSKQKWVYSLKNRMPIYDRHYIKLLFEKVGKDVYAIPIESISKENYKGDVYDLSVDEDSPNFLIGGNILVHNSTRSSIVDTLFSRGYLDGQSIKATELGEKLIETLEKHSPIIIDEELTRQLEEEMEKIQEDNNPEKLEKDEKAVIEKAKRIITDISKEFKAKENEISKSLAEGLKELREEQYQNNLLNQCSTCKQGNLRIMFNRASRRYFVSCSAYPNCRQTYSLPPNALIKKAENKVCEFDGFPKLLAIRKAKRPWEFCFNPNCEIEKKKREDWDNKTKEDKEG